MSKFSAFTNATKHILSTFSASKGGYGNSAMKGAAIGGGVGAAYGGISDNHTALGMGLAGATLGFGGGREYAGLKAWQKHLNTNAAKGFDKDMFKNRIYTDKTGMDGAYSYARKRFASVGA